MAESSRRSAPWVDVALAYARGAIQWLSADGATTTYSVSGLAFQPKALKFSWNGLQSATNAGSDTVHERRGWGFATGTTARRSIASLSEDAAAAALCAGGARNDAVACTIDNAGTFDGLLDLSAIASDGFTLIVDDAAPANITIFWEAWGGDDITVAAVGDIAEPAAIGTVDYTVTGFVAGANPGDQVVMFSGCQSTAALNTGANTDSGFCVGFATGAGENAVVAGNSDNGSATMDTDGYRRGDECLAMIKLAGGNPNARAALTQFNTDGFRLNWIARGLTGRRYIFLAIKGGRWRTGAYTIDATTLNATATVSGLPFQPIGLSTISGQAAESAAGTSNGPDAITCGSAASTTDRGCLITRDDNGAADSNIITVLRYDAMLGGPAAGGTAGMLADLDAILSDGFRTIMDLESALASTVWWNAYLAFAAEVNVYNVSLDEAATAADAVASVAALSASLAEPVTMAEAVASTATRPASMVETVNAAEAIGALLVGVAAVVASITPADAVSAAAVRPASLAEATTPAETVSAVLLGASLFGESVMAADAVSAGSASYSGDLAEPVTALDSVASVAVRPASVAEPVTTTETVSSGATLLAALGEAVTAVDSVAAGAASYSASLAEAATLVDAIGSALVGVAAVVDAMTAAETVTAAAAGYSVDIAEAVTALESVASVAVRPAPIAEPVTTADIISSVATLPASLAESAAPADAMSAGAATYSVSFVEAATALELLVSVLQASGSLNEPATAADSVAATTTVLAALLESIAAIDTVTATGLIGVSVVEGVTPADVLSSVAARDGAPPSRTITLNVATDGRTIRIIGRGRTIN